jgi:hypothetical protein
VLRRQDQEVSGSTPLDRITLKALLVKALQDFLFPVPIPIGSASDARKCTERQEFLASHHPHYRIVITILARGGTMRESSRCFGISDSAACALKRRLARDLLEHFGDEVIHRLLHGSRPGWESDLRASRKRHACHVASNRHEKVTA